VAIQRGRCAWLNRLEFTKTQTKTETETETQTKTETETETETKTQTETQTETKTDQSQSAESKRSFLSGREFGVEDHGVNDAAAPDDHFGVGRERLNLVELAGLERVGEATIVRDPAALGEHEFTGVNGDQDACVMVRHGADEIGFADLVGGGSESGSAASRGFVAQDFFQVL
jgi:hypothetical protein